MSILIRYFEFFWFFWVTHLHLIFFTLDVNDFSNLISINKICCVNWCRSMSCFARLSVHLFLFISQYRDNFLTLWNATYNLVSHNSNATCYFFLLNRQLHSSTMKFTLLFICEIWLYNFGHRIFTKTHSSCGCSFWGFFWSYVSWLKRWHTFDSKYVQTNTAKCFDVLKTIRIVGKQVLFYY